MAQSSLNKISIKFSTSLESARLSGEEVESLLIKTIVSKLQFTPISKLSRGKGFTSFNLELCGIPKEQLEGSKVIVENILVNLEHNRALAGHKIIK